MDPLTERLLLGWIIKRIRRWRTKRRMRSWDGHHLDEIREPFHEPTEGGMSETTQSFVRGVLKVLAGALVTKGVIDVGEVGALQVVLETAIAAGIGAWAFWQSHKKHAA
jgi:hypothetical protein